MKQRLGVAAALLKEPEPLKSIASATAISGLFAVSLGVLVQGSEFAWGTIETAQTQLPGRLTILSGRLASLAGLLLLMTVGLFAIEGAQAVPTVHEYLHGAYQGDSVPVGCGPAFKVCGCGTPTEQGGCAC